jgi:hypothetical protein
MTQFIELENMFDQFFLDDTTLLCRVYNQSVRLKYIQAY